MEKKVLDWIARHNMLSTKDNVIVAFSGGADSMALFHFLYTHRDVWVLNLSAAHFEHGLRGEDSLRDAAFVREVCQQYGVPLYCGEGNMSERQRPKGLGTEAWARQLRYQFLDGLAEKHGAKIALAHTLSDNAETVLFRAARGTGPRGLGGIPPVRGCHVRPLLPVSRQEIETYCLENDLPYRQDATNRDNHYSRNRLRNQVLPALEQVHPGAAGSLARLAADMRELDGWLDAQAQDLLGRAARPGPNGQTGYNAEILNAAPGPLRLKALALLAGDDIDRAALERARQVLAGERKAAQLPGGLQATLLKGRLYVGHNTGAEPLPDYAISLAPGRLELPGGYAITVEISETCDNFINCEIKRQKSLTFAADYAKINCGVFRTRRTGDTFAPKGRGVTKTVKKWMNEQGILPHMRDTLPLLADGSTVLWVWNEGFCHSVQPGAGTKRLLLIHCEEKRELGC